ncbi:hypothetical protein BJ912DRAFT_923270 [Pholiota molesta]|nr:hypothetical protein BJ912DRAFT_923270 [Pholiota molesta]
MSTFRGILRLSMLWACNAHRILASALIDLAWDSAIVRLQCLALLVHRSCPDSTQATIIEERDWKFDVNAKSVTLRRRPCFGQTRLTYFQRLGLDTTYFLRLEVGTNPFAKAAGDGPRPGR